jgi:ATP-dependent helicase/nuclease subunit A
MQDRLSGESFSIVWWDPALIDSPGHDTRGLRRDDLISKDARPEDVSADRARYGAWQQARADVQVRASKPSLDVVTATEWVRTRNEGSRNDVTIEDAALAGPRPAGRRFGVLVHALLGAVPIDATWEQIQDFATLHARMLGAPDEERAAAAAVVDRTLKHDVLADARAALAAGRPCRREAAISIVRDTTLVDGQVDLAFQTADGWTVVDFKTDAELGHAEDVYRRQVALYADALAALTGEPARGMILRI